MGDYPTDKIRAECEKGMEKIKRNYNLRMRAMAGDESALAEIRRLNIEFYSRLLNGNQS